MQIASIEFILFFAIVLVGFHILPSKLRCVFLLAASYIFYGSQNVAHLCVLVAATIVTYGSALFMQSKKENKKVSKAILITVATKR